MYSAVTQYCDKLLFFSPHLNSFYNLAFLQMLNPNPERHHRLTSSELLEFHIEINSIIVACFTKICQEWSKIFIQHWWCDVELEACPARQKISRKILTIVIFPFKVKCVELRELWNCKLQMDSCPLLNGYRSTCTFYPQLRAFFPSGNLHAITEKPRKRRLQTWR